MREIIGEDFRKFTEPGSMGVVNDVRYIRCIWPFLDEPVALFAEGSSGIEVQAPPTPKNVVFPEDTVPLGYMVDDGNVREGRRWRTTDIPTNLEAFSTKQKVTRGIGEMREFTKTVEVEPGIFAEAKYEKAEIVQKQVDDFTIMTPKQARAYAEGRKAPDGNPISR